jgi:hypothetical protein
VAVLVDPAPEIECLEFAHGAYGSPPCDALHKALGCRRLASVGHRPPGAPHVMFAATNSPRSGLL